MVMRGYRTVKKIAVRKATRGTETSKYPEEKEETSIPKVAASEMGGAQTMGDHGVAGHRETEASIAEAAWKGRAERVKPPYAKWTNQKVVPEYHRARETRWETGGPTPQG